MWSLGTDTREREGVDVVRGVDRLSRARSLVSFTQEEKLRNKLG